MSVYFYEKRDLECPACGAVLLWEARAVFNEHGDRMALMHPQTSMPSPRDPNVGMPCPHSGKRYYAPGVELDEIPLGK